MNRTKKVTIDRDLLAKMQVTSPRAAVLYEATGCLGPWTYDEYATAFGFETITPERPPQPEPPAEVVTAETAEDAARLAYEAATNAWKDAILAQRRHFHRGGRIIVNQGGPQPADRKGKAFDEAIDRAFEAREDAAEVLAKARRDAQRLRNQWKASL